MSFILSNIIGKNSSIAYGQKLLDNTKKSQQQMHLKLLQNVRIKKQLPQLVI